jgi:hypothetical protein
MARPELHLFERDLANKPGNGSSAPPRTIRAKDLDGNFRRLTLINSAEDPPAYQVEYTADGVRLTGISGLPEGATFKQFDVCENGQPVQYWMVTWEQNPSDS